MADVTAADTNTVWYADKGFLTVIIHMVAILVALSFKVQLNESTLITLAVLAGTFIAAHKAKSGLALVALIKSQAAAKFLVTPPATPLAAVAAGLDEPIKAP